MSVNVRLRLGYAESVYFEIGEKVEIGKIPKSPKSNKTATKSVSSMIFNKIFALTSSMRSGRSIASKSWSAKYAQKNYLKYVKAGKFLIPYCLARRLSLILTKSTPNESVSSSIFSSSANTLSQVTQLRASVAKPKGEHKFNKI
uniref:Uncharacterized protein n=1 Tax=Glossina austeni TaxID=7395 RepID=A0A1A9UIX4_GLOAU